jgi:hypothetical protein
MGHPGMDVLDEPLGGHQALGVHRRRQAKGNSSELRKALRLMEKAESQGAGARLLRLLVNLVPGLDRGEDVCLNVFHK